MKSALLATLLLTGCAKHYSVCIAIESNSGCTSRRFTLSRASELAGELANEPSDQDKAVWLQDNRKPTEPVPDLKQLRREMESQDKANKL